MWNLRKTVGKIADKADIAFLAYLEEADDDPTPTVRATGRIRNREGIRVFYLVTNASAQKAADFRREPRASLYLAELFRGVCLSGTVEVLEEPDGCVLKFTAERGRYYSDFKSENFEIPD